MKQNIDEMKRTITIAAFVTLKPIETVNKEKGGKIALKIKFRSIFLAEYEPNATRLLRYS